jgi:hypothetical protein
VGDPVELLGRCSWRRSCWALVGLPVVGEALGCPLATVGASVVDSLCPGCLWGDLVGGAVGEPVGASVGAPVELCCGAENLLVQQ